MDPYLESENLWSDVHATLTVKIANQLVAALRPTFWARISERPFRFLTSDPAALLYRFEGVMSVADVRDRKDTPMAGRQRFIEIQRHYKQGGGVVTIVHLVSPHEKMPGTTGERTLCRHRDATLADGVDWVEINLLRAGIRPTRPEVGIGSAYRTLVIRAAAPEQAAAESWNLRDPMPTTRVPVPGDDGSLDLRAALDAAYADAWYGDEIDYAADPPPPALAGEDATWLDATLREKGLR